MQRTCNNCHSSFKATDLDWNKGIAICTTCGTRETLAPQRLMPSPERFKVETTSESVAIHWKWFETPPYVMLFVSLVWNIFTFAFYIFTLRSTEDGYITLSLLFLPYIVAGLLIIYRAFSNLANYSTVTLTKEFLKVTHHPFWWPGQKQFPISSIKKLYVSQRKIRDIAPLKYYKLMALNQEDVLIPLLTHLKTLEEAKFLEQFIEERLNLEEQPVVDEA